MKQSRPRALRYATGQIRRVVHRTGTAAQVIGPLSPGVRVTGLTAGQFSAVDAMEHMVDELGPAAVRVSTWTTGVYDVERTRAIRVQGRIKDIRMLLDRGTFEKSPKYAGPLIEMLGVDAFRCLSVHAKIINVTGERGAAVMRSSMNLNKNLRTEQFDIDCEAPDGEVVGLYSGWFDALWDESGRSQDNRAIIRAVYDRYLENPTEENARLRRRKPSAGGKDAQAPRIENASFSVDELMRFIGD